MQPKVPRKQNKAERAALNINMFSSPMQSSTTADHWPI